MQKFDVEVILPLPINEFRDLIVCAFRYALGRTSYITYDISALLIKYKHLLHESDKEVIIRDIKRAIETNNYGMEYDKELWEQVLNEFSENRDE